LAEKRRSPTFLLAEEAATTTPIETRFAPDGVAYTLAVLDNYFDADTRLRFGRLLRLLLLSFRTNFDISFF